MIYDIFQVNRRKISRDETITEVRYGRFPDEYDKIYERVTSEKHFRNALEVLEERWRMIMFMYEDCQELVKEWEGRQLKRKQDRAKQRLYVYLSLASIVVVPLLLLVVIICWHLL
ncbi:hypothetical protein SNE40_010558 [Patella caerulea]|uniref:Uncharacterized protein n=1 Tax=Patella caerulea TaxID=87958 RepID=A0AAN8Q548_PATCE